MNRPWEPFNFTRVAKCLWWLSGIRLTLACTITLSLVPLCWIYVVLGTMLFGMPAKRYALGLLASVVAVIALNFHLGKNPVIWRRRWWLAGGLLVAWTAISVAAVWGRLGDFVPRGVVLLISVPASWYMLCVTWMFFYPWRWRTRFAWLAAFISLMAPYWIVLKLEGLTGDYRFNYVWRQWRTPQFDGDTQTTGGADLNELLTNATRGDYPQYLGPDRQDLESPCPGGTLSIGPQRRRGGLLRVAACGFRSIGRRF